MHAKDQPQHTGSAKPAMKTDRRVSPTTPASSTLSTDKSPDVETVKPLNVRTKAYPWSPIRRRFMLFRSALMELRSWYLRKIMKMDLHPNVKISLKANLDLTNPRGIHVDDGTYIAFRAVILAHDMSRVLHTDTYIGRNCFIGAHSIIMPGVRVGDGCIVASRFRRNKRCAFLLNRGWQSSADHSLRN